MITKMVPLINKVSSHYNEKEKKKWLKIIKNYCSNIPILGFNSGGYDINLVSNCGFIQEIYKRCSKPVVIKNGNKYKVIKTNTFTFLDQMCYCAAGTDLRKFIQAYLKDSSLQKGYFPYEWFDCIEKLDYLVSDLKIENFNSKLKNSIISLDDFTALMKTCNSLNLITVRDLLEWYNNLFQFSLKGFKEYLKQKPPKTDKCFCPTNIEEKIAHYMEQDIKAGRCIEERERLIIKEEVVELFRKQNYVCKYCWYPGTVYKWSLDRIDCSKAHISGNCVIACVDCNRQRKTTFIGKFYRRKALIRFAKLEQSSGLIHPMMYLIDETNKRVFYKLQQNIVGGPSIVYHRYHEKDKTTIDRLKYNNGEWSYSGNAGKLVNQIIGFDANALYLYCLQQEQLCGKLCWIPTEEEYKIEFAEDTKEFTTKEQFEDYVMKRQLNNKQKELQISMNDLGCNPLSFLESFFGLIELDIEVPPSLYNYFGEMAPIFKNAEYNEALAGQYTTDIILKSHSKTVSNRKLIASLKAARIVINSNLLKWYIEKGLIITKVYGIIPAQRGTPFKEFGDWVSNERRKGDVDLKFAIIAEAAKVIGNSAFGRTIMNKNNFKIVKFSNEKQFNRAKNSYFFSDAEYYDGKFTVGKVENDESTDEDDEEVVVDEEDFCEEDYL